MNGNRRNKERRLKMKRKGSVEEERVDEDENMGEINADENASISSDNDEVPKAQPMPLKPRPLQPKIMKPKLRCEGKIKTRRQK